MADPLIRKPVHAVAFDFFGTLGHWQPGTVGSPAQALYAAAENRERLDTRHLVDLVEGLNGSAQFDTEPSPDEYAAWETRTWRAAADYAGVPVTPQLLDELREIITRRSLVLYPDVLPALEALHELGIPWVLCSNASPDVEGKLRTLLPAALAPRACAVSCRVGARKPHPRIFAAALRQLRPYDAGQVLFVGDRVDCDVAGPAAAGFQTAFLDRTAQLSDAPPSGATVSGAPPSGATVSGATVPGHPHTPVWRDLQPLAATLKELS
ncbi:HAD family hydrolase [Streptomyces monticola]|uniref:HAD family hydrolase n=1 Tax=Streptomyces monticola TaxID=2666263 RepID=A0ABW2JFZ6_9ACTN